MELTKLFEVQAGLKKHIGYKGKDKFPKMMLAMLVEFMECANDWRGFKYWSKNQVSNTSKEIECYSCDGKGVQLDYGAMSFWDCETCDGTGELQSDANPLLEEYVDGLHFVLETGLDLLETNHIITLPMYISAEDIPGYDMCKNPVKQYKELCRAVLLLEDVIDGTDYIDSVYISLFEDYLNLGKLLGFTPEQIRTAYMEKNAENHQRQDNGY